MTDFESFTFIDTRTDGASPPAPLSNTYEQLTSARVADTDIQILGALRTAHPSSTITAVPAFNIDLLTYAALGHATAVLETESDNVFRWRGYVPSRRRGGTGFLADSMFYAQYRYTWGREEFLVFQVSFGGNMMQYIVKSPDAAHGETAAGNCAATDALLVAAATILMGDESKFVYVYDRYWTRSRELWEEVQNASWDKVILDAALKKDLQEATTRFFDSKEVYSRYGVPWKRGLIFWGPPGNGKTSSLKALMKTLYDRAESIPTLYVKSAPQVWNIQQVFQQARNMAPCLLIMEDVETIVTPETRSYFFNEMDGLASNDGLFIIASTNYLDRLDPGLSQRPSRFDRKYLFPLPNKAERTLYAEYWRHKLATQNPSLDSPKSLCPAMADITDAFSFAYMQEAFVATLLILAKEEILGAEDHPVVVQSNRGKAGFGWICCLCCEGGIVGPDCEGLGHGPARDDKDDKEDLDKYKLWRVFKEQVKALREQIGGNNDGDGGHGGGDDDYYDSGSESDYDNTGKGNINNMYYSADFPPQVQPARFGGLGINRPIPINEPSGNGAPRARSFVPRNLDLAFRGRGNMFPQLDPPMHNDSVLGRGGPSHGVNLRGGFAGQMLSPEQELAQVGLGKSKYFTETAFETRL